MKPLTIKFSEISDWLSGYLNVAWSTEEKQYILLPIARVSFGHVTPRVCYANLA